LDNNCKDKFINVILLSIIKEENNMKKIIVTNFLVALMILTVIGSCYPESGVIATSQQVQSQDIEMVETGTIKGTIINQNGRPIAFVRVIAAGSPNDNATKMAFTYTHLLIGGVGNYSLEVPVGRYLFVRASKLPFYLGGWAGPIVVTEGESITLDLSITYIGPKNSPIVFPRFLERFPLLNLLLQRLRI
jgi:hypothetical protein